MMNRCGMDWSLSFHNIFPLSKISSPEISLCAYVTCVHVCLKNAVMKRSGFPFPVLTDQRTPLYCLNIILHTDKNTVVLALLKSTV